jgi:RNA polymerase sigma-70 factor (ECF subfamily)
MTREAIGDHNQIAGTSARELDLQAELVRRAKERSPHAWASIYEQNFPRIFRYIHARTGNRETAEDLASTVFLEALKSIDGYRYAGKPLLAWLYRIARNVVNYHHRASFRKRGDATECSLDAATGGSGSVPFPGVAGHVDLMRALDRLSQDQREVIILRYFVGLTTPEVATVTGRKERAVYSLQARAIKALRRQLE